MTFILRDVALTLVPIGLLIATYVFGNTAPLPAPTTGVRGLKRGQVMRSGHSFAYVEPAVRQVAAWLAPIPAPGVRQRIRQQLVLAGDWLGLSANEFLGLSLLSTVGGGSVAAVLCWFFDLPALLVPFLAILGAMSPWLRVTGRAAERFKQINRGLPPAIDLAALCMGAGLDFPGAMRQVVLKSDREDAFVDEFERFLQELELGHTRRKALEAFALRAPTDAVKDFVGAVVQALEKGNPLAEVLSIQASMLRMRRSVAAEESAARAALMLMVPLMLIFVCILLILLGPFIITGMAVEG